MAESDEPEVMGKVISVHVDIGPDPQDRCKQCLHRGLIWDDQGNPKSVCVADFGDGWGIDLKDGRLAECTELERKADEAERNAKTLAALRERVEGWSESAIDTDDVLRLLGDVERLLMGDLK